MDEKILDLLQLCLTAKKHGVPVWFSYSPHADNVNVYALVEGWEDVLPDETPERAFSYYIYLDFRDAGRRISEAEKSIKDLIEERGKNT